MVETIELQLCGSLKWEHAFKKWTSWAEPCLIGNKIKEREFIHMWVIRRNTNDNGIEGRKSKYWGGIEKVPNGVLSDCVAESIFRSGITGHCYCGMWITKHQCTESIVVF